MRRVLAESRVRELPDELFRRVKTINPVSGMWSTVQPGCLEGDRYAGGARSYAARFVRNNPSFCLLGMFRPGRRECTFAALRPGKRRVVFLPAPGADRWQVSRDQHLLTAELKERLGKRWGSDLEARTETVSQVEVSRRGQRFYQLMDRLWQLIQTTTFTETRQMIEAHPELLGLDADRALEGLLSQVSSSQLDERNSQIARHIVHRRNVLQQCRATMRRH